MDFECGEVGAQCGDGGCGAFDEGDVRGAAAESLNSDGAGAGVEVGKAGSFDARREDVEDRLAEAVAGGTRGHAGGRGERAAAIGAGDDTHGDRRTRIGRQNTD